MANNAISNQIYNHFLTTYVSNTKDARPASATKKEDLKGIYRSIVKLSQDSPLFLMKHDDSVEEGAISLKESAHALEHTVSVLGDMDEDALFDHKTAFSTDDSLASASYIGSGKGNVPSFDLRVDNLAQTQVNTGRFLPDRRADLDSGTYSFDTRVGDQSYEFQFSVYDGDTNRDIQDRLVKLFNKAGVRLDASLEENGGNLTAIRLESQATGQAQGREYQFEISENDSELKHGLVDYFGIDQVAQKPMNANFSIDGNVRSSSANRFTVAGLYELNLHRASEADEAATIGVKNDSDSLIDHIHELSKSYNNFLGEIRTLNNHGLSSAKIMGQIRGIARDHQDDLSALGIGFDDDGRMTIDDSLLTQDIRERGGITNEEMLQAFAPIQKFASAVSAKTNEFSLDPMKFADRPIVNYKNPGHGTPNPYITSEYSGMLFNNYC